MSFAIEQSQKQENSLEKPKFWFIKHSTFDIFFQINGTSGGEAKTFTTENFWQHKQ